MIFSWIGLLFNLKRFAAVLLKYWKVTVVVIAIATGLWYYNGLINQIEDLTKQVTYWEDENKKCKGAIDEQNAQIEFWVNKGRKQKKELDKLKDIIDATKQDYDKQIGDILKEPKPKNCEDAIEYLHKGRKDLTW